VSTGLHDGGGGCFGVLFTHVRGAKPARRTDRHEARDGGRTCQRRISGKKNGKILKYSSRRRKNLLVGGGGRIEKP